MNVAIILLLLICEMVWVRGFEWGFPSVLALIANLFVGYRFFSPKISEKIPNISPEKFLYVAVLVAVGTLFHFYAITTIPHDMYGFDVARDTQQVQQVTDTKKMYILYQNFSKEPVFYHLAAVVDTIVHNEFLSLKIIGAAAGVIAAVTLFFILSALRIRPFISFFTSMLFSFSSWQILMERLGYRASLVPFFVMLVFAITIRYFKHPSARLAYFLGIVLAAGFYVYTTYWVVPLGVGVFLMFSFITSDSKKRALLLKTLLFSIVSFVITLAPLFSFIYQHPEVYFQRMRQRSQEVVARNFTLEQKSASFYRNYTNSIKGVFLQGTAFPPYENTSPFQKGLDDITMWLFLGALGFVLITYKHRESQLAVILLLIALVPTSMMSIGYESETPNFSRMIVALPIIYILIAFFINGIAKYVHDKNPKSKWLFYGGYGVALVALIFVANQNTHRIFVDFPMIYPFQNQPIYSLVREEHLQNLDKNIYMFFNADPEVMERYIPSYKGHIFFGESIGVADYGRLYLPDIALRPAQKNDFIIVFSTEMQQQIDMSRYACSFRTKGSFTFGHCSSSQQYTN